MNKSIQQLCVLGLVTLALSACANAISFKNVQTVTPAVQTAAMEDIVPGSVGKLHKLIAAKSDRAAAQAALDAISAIRKYRDDHAAELGSASNITDIAFTADSAELGAWPYVVRIYKSTSDPAVRKMLLKAWDSCLLDERTTEWMLNALIMDWEPAFLTRATVDLFRQSRDTRVVASFSTLFVRHSQPGFEALLRDKLLSVQQDKSLSASQRWCNIANLERSLKELVGGTGSVVEE